MQTNKVPSRAVQCNPRRQAKHSTVNLWATDSGEDNARGPKRTLRAAGGDSFL